MNNRQLYLAWLRTTAPETYITAIRKVAGKPRGSGGLKRDLVGSMLTPTTGFGFLGDDTTDLQTITVSAPIDSSAFTMPVVDTSTFTTPAIEIPAPTDVFAPPPDELTGVTVTAQKIPVPGPAPTTDLWTQITTAVAGLAATALTSSQQSNLVKLNTARAAAGLPPVDANGRVITTSAVARPPSAALAAIEAQIAGMGSSPIVWIAGLGLLAFLFMRKR
jgi:hypothetical protein